MIDYVCDRREHSRGSRPGQKPGDDRFIAELVARAETDGLERTGEGGLLQQLTKRLLEFRAR